MSITPTRENAIKQLQQRILESAAAARDGIGDSDLDDEQPVTVTIKTTLGELRKAGLRRMPGYSDPDSFCRPDRRYGARVRSLRSPDFTGKIVGWDKDLGLPLVQWDGGWAAIGLEACKPDEYELIGESAESLQDRHDDLHRDTEMDAALEHYDEVLAEAQGDM